MEFVAKRIQHAPTEQLGLDRIRLAGPGIEESAHRVPHPFLKRVDGRARNDLEPSRAELGAQQRVELRNDGSAPRMILGNSPDLPQGHALD